MSRTLTTIDRVLVLLLALGLIAAGVVAALWQSGRVSQLNGTITAPWLSTAAAARWWPWAVGAVGVVLVILALRWIAAHISGSKVRDVRLPGSTTAGRLTVDLGALATAAATSVQDTPGVRSATGKALDDRGQRTLALTVTIDPHADLATVTAVTDRACRDLGAALGDPHTATRVHLHTARKATGGPRVA